MINKFRKIMNDTKMKMIAGVCIILILGLISFTYIIDISSNSTSKTVANNTTTASKTTTNNTKNIRPVEEVYKPTTEENLVLKKSYEDFTGNDYTKYNDLDKKYDSMSENKCKNYIQKFK